MITNFWNWMITTVTNGVNLLNTMVNSTTLKPFFDLFLVVAATIVIVKYILKPVLGYSGSDKARKKEEEE